MIIIDLEESILSKHRNTFQLLLGLNPIEPFGYKTKVLYPCILEN